MLIKLSHKDKQYITLALRISPKTFSRHGLEGGARQMAEDYKSLGLMSRICAVLYRFKKL